MAKTRRTVESIAMPAELNFHNVFGLVDMVCTKLRAGASLVVDASAVHDMDAVGAEFLDVLCSVSNERLRIVGVPQSEGSAAIN